MGVPKFFRYISERYPCLSELVRENQIPQFDNLYLDMNGIIHVCSHPDDTNVQFRISEEQIFKDVFFYIEVLFRLIQPQKLLFMAIDGVAPRAKMNQQRGRRFRTAKEAELLEAKAKSKGEVIPSQSRFDSNCITPGTEFMVRLQIALKYFVQAKISANPIWQKCRVILSGHETPGEGEHKIMEYIRYLKSRKNYDPNTRHCLYGLDADLIMLGLCSHELHFSLLREEVKFSKKAKRAVSADETSFYLLHLGLLREYLELEFKGIENKLSFPYDKEKIIDDWVFLGFLVGNDFIPHLPNLHINSNALPILYNTYMEILPKIDGYINNNGWLDLKRLEVFMESLADVDRNLFAEQYADLKYFHSKTGQDSKAKSDSETFDFNVTDIGVSNSDNDLLDLVKATEEMFTDDLDDMDMPYANMEDDDKFIEQEFLNHKRDYYINKLKYPEMTPEVLAEQTECYIRALQWTLSYYYHGVQSWGWFYPHHYAPYISDIKNFSNLKIDFTIGTPFLPYQQLLAVLPAASKELLPKAYRELMTNQNSELIEYYPTEFLTDLNGKKQEWEAVVLIPLIDEKKLLNAMNKCDNALTDEERTRNIHGPMVQYDHTSESQEMLKGPYNFPCMPKFAKETLVTREEIYVPENQLVFESLKGSLSNVYFPGFPTMKHLQYTGEIKKLKVKVFDQPSRNDNLIIQVVQNDAKDTNVLAKELLGKEIFVGWPHLREAKVIRVSDYEKKYNLNGDIQDNDQRTFHMQASGIIDHHLNRMGIELGDITQLVHVNLIAGREYVHTANGKMTLQKIWDNVVVAYPAQTIVKDIAVHSPDFVQFTTFEKIYAPGSVIFMLCDPYYGCQGEVIDPELIHKFGRIKISLYVHPVPDFTSAIKIHNSSGSKYFNSYNAASRCQINHNVLSRISGTVLVVQGEKRSNLPESTPKLNIGLQLKFVKNNEEIVGYTKKVGSQWLYSDLAIELINSYCDEYPEIVEQLSKRNNFDLFFEADLFPNKERQISVSDVAKWIKEQPHYNADRRTCGTQTVEKETVEAIIEAVANTRNEPIRRLTLQAKPYLLYKPGLKISSKQPDENAKYELFDRVVIARNAYTVPIGHKGTIISISRVADPNPVRQECLKTYDMYYEVLFDNPFPEGNSFCGIADKCVYKVPQNVLINLTYGSSEKTNTENNRNTIQQPFIEYAPSWKNLDSNPSERKSSEKIKHNNNVQNVAEVNTKQLNSDKTPNLEEKKIQMANKTSVLEKKENITVVPENKIKNTTGTDDRYEQIWSMMKQKIPPFPLPTFNTENNNSSNSMATPANPDDSTDMLKKLLGLKEENDGKAIAAAAAVAKPEQQVHQKINLDDMFDKFKTHNKPVAPIIQKLPAPPENWRNSTTKKKDYVQIIKPSQRNQNQHYSHSNNNNDMGYQPRQNFVQYDNHPPTKRDPFFVPYDSIQHKNFVGMGRQRDQQQNYSNQHQKQFNYNYQNTPQKPNGPQTLRDDNNAQLGHGAFIPLQVIRSHSKPKPVQQPPTQFVQRNAEQRQIIQQKQEESRQNFASFINNSTPNDNKDNLMNSMNHNRPPQTKTTFVQKPRSSRIAANFNIQSTK